MRSVRQWRRLGDICKGFLHFNLPAVDHVMKMATDGPDFIDDEIQYAKRGEANKKCPEAELVTCHKALVRYHIR